MLCLRWGEKTRNIFLENRTQKSSAERPTNWRLTPCLADSNLPQPMKEQHREKEKENSEICENIVWYRRNKPSPTRPCQKVCSCPDFPLSVEQRIKDKSQHVAQDFRFIKRNVNPSLQKEAKGKEKKWPFISKLNLDAEQRRESRLKKKHVMQL